MLFGQKEQKNEINLNHTKPLSPQISNALGLGKTITLPTPAHGGLLHRMWKVTTEKGSYAVKELAVSTIFFTSEVISLVISKNPPL